jgi:hypothetical protein
MGIIKIVHISVIPKMRIFRLLCSHYFAVNVHMSTSCLDAFLATNDEPSQFYLPPNPS